jgi:hypothetical protein
MNFALITEGVSEHRIIKHFILKYLRGNEIEINQIQPQIWNNKQQNFGGWNEVLKYCGRTEIKNILDENDYLVIQVDSDVSPLHPFSVSHSDLNGHQKSIEQLCNDIITKLKSLIIPEILLEYEEKIIFAICVHTIECWLVHHYCPGNSKRTLNNCIKPLNNTLRRRNMLVIPNNKNNSNGIKAYNELLSEIRKDEILEASKFNFGLEKFIISLDQIVASHLDA